MPTCSLRREVNEICLRRRTPVCHPRELVVQNYGRQPTRLPRLTFSPASLRQRTDMVLSAHIHEQFRLSLGSYSKPYMTEELKELHFDFGHCRVGRSTRQNVTTVKRHKNFKATTDSNHSFNIAPNLLTRGFLCDRPNQNLAGDISQVWTEEDGLYLAVIL